MELRDGGVLQTENTSELIKMIRRASEALDKAMAVANVDYFAPHLETLRTDILELFRRLLIRNPYSSYRKDVASKMWFRTIYPSIEQYRANIKQFETMLGWPAASRGSQQQGSSDGSTGADAIAVRRELSKWRARFQRFLQASSGSLLRVVAELAESNELAAARSLSRLSDFATDYRALAVHAYGFEFVDGLRSELHPTLKPVQRAALAIISRLLIYLGDLSRYRILYTSKKQSIAGMVRAVSSGQPQQHKSLAGATAAAAAAAASSAAAAEASSVSLSSPSLAVAHHDLWWPAKNFYRGASRLAPHRGQAYNQLAVVHGYEKNSLDGIFCYYRALTALISFMPAEANLKTILDNAVRAIDDGDNKGGDASDLGVHTGYLYYEHKVYQKFTHLRCLFAMYQPTARERADLLATGKLAERLVITPDLERQLFSDIGTASARFVHGVKTGSVSLRHALVAQGIHILELQRLSALSTDDSEVALHSLAVTRLSAHLAMGVAQGLCAFVAASITDALRNANRVREVKSEGDLLSKACRRAVPALVQTLVWLVSACVRVVRDSTARDYVVAHGAPVSALRRLVFEAVRDCGLMASVAALRTVMVQARAKVNRRAMGAGAADPPALSWPDMVLSESIAPLARQLWPSFGGVASETGEGSLRLEEELFVGWRLPDGTVWGRQSEDGHLETAASASASVEVIDSGSSSDEDGFQVRCRQLWCLLHVVSECVPAVESIISGIPASMGAVTATAVVESKNNSIGGRAAGKRGQEDDDDDDEEVGEEETICFQGRSVPSTGIKQGQQQPHLAASPMMPESIIQSIPPTPDMRQDGRKFFRVQADKQETAEAPVPPTTMMTSLGIGSLATSLSLPPPPPLLATSVSFSGAENTGLVDREKDEVVSPAMIAASSQNRTNARVAAIGSQRLPLGGNAASVSTKLPLSAVSDSHQWPFYSSGPSTAPVSPDAIASGAASVSAGGFYSSPNYPTVIKASAPMSVGETPAAAAAAAVGSGWDTLLPHQQQRQNTPGQTALLAWQQYQIEYQKKQALQQQLDQQQMIQQHLQQQLLVQQKQNPAALFGNNPSFSAPQQQQQFIGGASASGGLDPTTASVLNMAMSMPPSGSAAEDEKPSLLSVYGSYNLPRSTDMISASASALAAATAPVSAPMYPGGTAT
ncbi:hypothetical protein LPJ56_002083, partial [Coemansia sp. RSA 2599]